MNNEQLLLTCKGCGRALTASGFYPRPNNRSGLSTKCRECIKGEYQAWYANNAERRKATERARRARINQKKEQGK